MSTKNVIFSNPGDVIDFVKIVEKWTDSLRPPANG